LTGSRVVLSMAAVLAGLLAGCSQPPAPGEPVRLRLAHVYELKSPTHAFGTAHLAQRLAAAGVGLDVSVFPAAQLGSEAELLEQLVAFVSGDVAPGDRRL